jgi:ATP-dependent phosphofructokinase / diphosphate-dependent phosphofructokinase
MAIALVAHSGGPTAVINASLLGVVEEARRHRRIDGLWGARFGIDGILREDFADLSRLSAEKLQAIGRAPSSALGTSRREVTPAEVERLVGILRARDVRHFFYTGGNGSMGTAAQIAAAAAAMQYGLQVVGIPKTIDNDLEETDHTPGYATTARFFACALRDIGGDNRALPGQVEFVEVLGRNAGWLVAATALARHAADDAPHLIYFPEVRLPLDRLLGDIEAVYRRLGRSVVAICEGQLDEHGEPFGADERAGSRGKLAMNLAHRLSMVAAERLGLRTRSEKPGLLGRSGLAYPCPRDWQDAYACGSAAVRAAMEGQSGVMVTLAHDGSTGLAPLEKVAFVERLFPAEWRSEAGNDVRPEFLDYVRPLVGEVEPYGSL